MRRKGITLLEVLASMLVLSIGLFIVGGVMSAQFSFINQVRENTIATLSAQEVIDHVRGMAFDDIINTDLTNKFNDPNDSRPQGFSYLSSPTATVTLGYGGYSDHNNIRQLFVAVSWDSISGKRLQKNLTTLVTRNGIDNQ